MAFHVKLSVNKTKGKNMNEFNVIVKIKANTLKEAINKVPEEIGEVVGVGMRPNTPKPTDPKSQAPQLG